MAVLANVEVHPDQCTVECCDYQPLGHWHGPPDSLRKALEPLSRLVMAEVLVQERRFPDNDARSTFHKALTDARKALRWE